METNGFAIFPFESTYATNQRLDSRLSLGNIKVNLREMRYYIRENNKAPVQGPFSIHQLATKVLDGRVHAHFLASSDLGEPVSSLHKWRRCDWFPLSQIPDLSFPKRKERKPIVSVAKQNQKIISTLFAVGGLASNGAITSRPLKYLITALSALILLDLLRQLSPIHDALQRRKAVKSGLQKETTEPCT